MVFLIVLLADPMFGSCPYSPYPRVKFCWSLLSIVVFSKSHYLTLLLRTSCIPFFGLHLFLTPLSLRQKGFYLFSPVVPGVIRLPQSNSIYFMDSLLPLGWLNAWSLPNSIFRTDLIRVTARFLWFLKPSEPILDRVILQSCLLRCSWSCKSPFRGNSANPSGCTSHCSQSGVLL